MKLRDIRIIAVFVFMIILITSGNVNAALEGPMQTSEDGYQYAEILNDDSTGTGNIILYRYEGEYTEVMEVPAQIDGKNVVEASTYLFSLDETVKKIILPDTLKKVATYTFYYCPNLETVVFPETIEYIEKTFYLNCDNLVNYNIPDTLEELGKKLNIAHIRVATITANGIYNYDLANDVIELINEIREENNLEPYIVEDEMMDFTITRAPELSIYLGHERTCGLSVQSLMENQYIPVNEIIGAGQVSAEEIVNQWMNSQLHRPTIMSEEYVYCGAACYNVDGSNYWIFAASAKGNATTEDSYEGEEAKKVEVKVSKYHNYIKLTSVEGLEETNTLMVNDTIEPEYVKHENTPAYREVKLEPSDVEWSSSDDSVLSVDENGKITALSAGTATIRVTLLNSYLEYNFTVESNGEEPGEGPGEEPGEGPGEGPGEEPGEEPGDGPTDEPGNEPTNQTYKGDVNKDGLVDSADAAIVLNLYKYNNATAEDIRVADMDENGMLDSADAAIILNCYKYNIKEVVE